MVESFVKDEIMVILFCLTIVWVLLVAPVWFTSADYVLVLLVQPFMLFPYALTLLAVCYCVFMYRRFK